ncbi:MAG TPA: hypothetical protein VGJ04_05560 [Pirellulales bacterium]
MDSSENEILISAYLDDELTVEERARVEQLLATNSESRQLLDEMRALRGGLQELPQHKLEIDFAQHVLKKAEQSNADGQTAATASDPTDSSRSHPSPLTSRPSPLGSGPSFPRPFARRGIAWSLVAVAAAVVIMVATKRPDQNQRSAPSTAQPSFVRAPAIQEQQSADRRDMALDHAENGPQVDTLKEALKEKDLGTNADESAAARHSGNPAPAISNGFADDNNDRFSRDATTNKQLPGGVQLGTPLAADKPSYFNRAGSGGSLSNSLAAPQATPVSPSVNPPMVRMLESTAGDEIKGVASPGAGIDGQQPLADGAGPVLVIRADMSADAARGRAFDQLLVKNSIAVPDDKELAKSEIHRKLADKKADAEPSVKDGSLDVVYVEAAPEQIESTLDDLRNSPHIFSAVAVSNLQQSPASREIPNLSLSTEVPSEPLPASRTKVETNANPPTDRLQDYSQQRNRNSQALGRSQRLFLPNETIGQLSAGQQESSEEKRNSDIAATQSVPSDTSKITGMNVPRGETKDVGSAATTESESAAGRPTDFAGPSNRQSPAIAAPQSSALPYGAATPPADQKSALSQSDRRSIAPSSVDADTVNSERSNARNRSAQAAPQQRALFLLRIVDGGGSDGKPQAPAATPSVRSKASDLTPAQN